MTWTLPEQHLMPDAVVAFVDGELTPAAHDRAATHAARCPFCSAEIAAQRQARAAVRSADTPGAPAGLLAALRAIPQEVDPPTAPDGLAVTHDGQLVALQRPTRSTPRLSTSPTPPAVAASARDHGATTATSGPGATTAARGLGAAAAALGAATTTGHHTNAPAAAHPPIAPSRPEAFAAGEPLGSSPRLGESRSVLGRRAGAGVVVSGLFLGALALVNTSGGAPAWLNTSPLPGDVEWVSSVGSRLFTAR